MEERREGRPVGQKDRRMEGWRDEENKEWRGKGMEGQQTEGL